MSFDSPSALAPGFKLDRYELLCPIAEGGMASVWIARQTGKHGFQKLVAIKTILPKYAAEPRFQEMFVDEARIASRIEHANVAQILDVGEQHDVTYLVMEYVDGDALSRLHRAARKAASLIPPGIVLRVMADVCGGLHAAHELHGADGKPLGVVHRDVSPQNVLLSTRGVAKLIDFGIAKARDRLAGDTNAETLKGKVQYMAPEQALGRPVDRRADLWAVGAVLHHLLGGKPPFEADNEIQTLFVLSSGRPPPPLRGVHGAVAAVVRRALSHSPAARYATAAEMQQALEDAIIQAGLSTTPATIASYLAAQMGDRAGKRREAVSLGLKAAEDREKVAALMRSNTEVHPSSLGSGNGSSSPGLSSRGASSSIVPIAILGSAEATSPSTATGKTLDAAALSLPPIDNRRGLRFALLGGAMGAAVAVLVLVAVIAGRGQPPAAAARPAPAVATLQAPVVQPAPAAPALPDSARTVPVVAESPSASASPPAMTAPARPVWRPAPASAAAVAPTPRPTAARPAAVPTRVNDGF